MVWVIIELLVDFFTVTHELLNDCMRLLSNCCLKQFELDECPTYWLGSGSGGRLHQADLGVILVFEGLFLHAKSLDGSFLAHYFVVASDHFGVFLVVFAKFFGLFCKLLYIIKKIRPHLHHLLPTRHLIQPLIHQIDIPLKRLDLNLILQLIHILL